MTQPGGHAKGTTRRRFVAGAAAGAAAAPVLLRAGGARAKQSDVDAAILKATRGVAPKLGRVKVEVPPLAETGTSVGTAITVESPMTAADHVKEIHIFLPGNPEPDAVTFFLGPRAGAAHVATRLRMFEPQWVHAVAILSDGSAWLGKEHVEVTLAACIEIPTR